MTDEILSELIITKVNSRGQKRKRVKCRPGFKLNSTGTSCVPMSGGEKAGKRRAIRKSIRTKRAGGTALKRRTTRKRLRALKRRKSLGL